jgi:hypothetical protein
MNTPKSLRIEMDLAQAFTNMKTITVAFKLIKPKEQALVRNTGT